MQARACNATRRFGAIDSSITRRASSCRNATPAAADDQARADAFLEALIAPGDLLEHADLPAGGDGQRLQHGLARGSSAAARQHRIPDGGRDL